MVSTKINLAAPAGLHARLAGELVKLVKEYAGSEVQIVTPQRSVNAASILSLLSLGAKCGAELEVRVDGGREEEALVSIAHFLETATI
ncbi:MAG: HPr family phosphocarrier protein [Bacteroidales bacterium]|nr:HPr family phosphocarrier protein [Bacteroidales bacterium]